MPRIYGLYWHIFDSMTLYNCKHFNDCVGAIAALVRIHSDKLYRDLYQMILCNCSPQLKAVILGLKHT